MIRQFLVGAVCLAHLVAGAGIPAQAGAPRLPERPAQQGGNAQICVALFDDLDEDGLWTAGEPLLAGGTFGLSGPATGAYTTDGISEPHCFTGLVAGDYVVSVTPPPGYYLTSLERIPVTLSSSSGEVRLSFGAALQRQGSLPPSSQQSPPAGGMSTVLIVIVAVVIVLVAVGAGVGVFLLIYRRGK